MITFKLELYMPDNYSDREQELFIASRLQAMIDRIRLAPGHDMQGEARGITGNLEGRFEFILGVPKDD